jgi:hypothetical protein
VTTSTTILRLESNPIVEMSIQLPDISRYRVIFCMCGLCGASGEHVGSAKNTASNTPFWSNHDQRLVACDHNSCQCLLKLEEESYLIWKHVLLLVADAELSVAN